ncbi:MAG TPA: 4'-phosphopantetheinyl transferase superfamily protein [Anaerolineaceae bacterium]|nr:4'-phosphopantetheinyl transferase superfamily protein [Anaerolineaceae bacterium]
MAAILWEKPHARLRMPAGRVHIWLTRVVQDPVMSPGVLSRDELERANRFKVKAAKIEFIQARMFLRRTLARYLFIDPSAIRLCTSPYGKPFLEPSQNWQRLEFNLSHRDGLCLLAVTRGRRIGIDLELVRATVEMEQIVTAYFSTTERIAYSRLRPQERLEGFTRGWTCKEAYLKAAGKGFHQSLTSFSVELNPTLPPRIIASTGGGEEDGRFKLFCFTPAENTRAAVAVEGRGTELSEWNFYQVDGETDE